MVLNDRFLPYIIIFIIFKSPIIHTNHPSVDISAFLIYRKLFEGVLGPTQKLTVDATVVGSIASWGYKMFSFPSSGNGTKCGVIFHYTPYNVLKIL